MKKIKQLFKGNFKFIFGIILGLLITSPVVYAATIYYNGINVGYNNSTSGFKDSNGNNIQDVQTAIDELYVKASSSSGGGSKTEYNIYRWSQSSWYPGYTIWAETEGVDYVLNKSNLINMNTEGEKYFLKYHIFANEIIDAFVCFVVTDDMESSYTGMTAGEYCLLGGDSNRYYTNVSIIYDAFGALCGGDRNLVGKDFACEVPGFYVSADLNGNVNVWGENNYCGIAFNGSSECM